LTRGSVTRDYLHAHDDSTLTSFRLVVSVIPSSHHRCRRIKKEFSRLTYSHTVKGGFDVYNIETAMPKIDLDAIESHLRAAREEERRVSDQHSFYTNQ